MGNVSDIEEALAELDKPASEDARLLVDLWALEHSGKYESAQTANADLAKRIESYAAKQVAAALEAERAKGPGVWTDAPEWATEACVQWESDVQRGQKRAKKWYTRALPKSPARLRAESIIGDQLEGEEREKAITALEGALG